MTLKLSISLTIELALNSYICFEFEFAILVVFMSNIDGDCDNDADDDADEDDCDDDGDNGARQS